MTNARLAPEADTAGYVVFKLGGGGALIGLAVGVLAGGGPALETWLTYSLSVSAAGALLASLAWVGRTRAAREERPLARLQAQQVAVVPEPRPERADRPRVSAFRAAPRQAR